MKVAAYNIRRGIDKKIDIIEGFCFEDSISILGLSEADLLEHELPPPIQNYVAIKSQGPISRVAVYVHENFDFKVIPYDGKLPAVVLQTAQLSIAYIYSGFTENPYQSDSHRLTEKERSNHLQDFFDWFSTRCTKNSLILGDCNVDWSANSVSRNKLLTWCFDNNFTQIINSPTRFGVNSLGQDTESCLDLCFLRHENKKISSSTTKLPFSDHLGISVVVGRQNIKSQNRVVKKWKFTKELLNYARENPPVVDDSISDVNTLALALTNWLSDINSMAQNTINIRSPPTSSPWYSPDLATLRSKYTALPRGSLRNQYRNLYVSKVRSAKRLYVRKLALKLGNNGGVWRAIRKSKFNNSNEMKIVIDDKSINDPPTIANGFKSFFQSKVENLTKNHDPTEIFTALSDKFQQVPEWDLDECTEAEVSKAIDDLKPTLSSGPDNIPGLLLKHVKFEIIPLFTRIINCSISSGLFPSIWNSGKIIPVHKNGSKTSLSNYRPICISSVMGKVVETVIRSKFLFHLERILPENMFGFRKSKSTQDCVTLLTDRIFELKASGQKVAVLALDASAAFDCLSHDVILSSMKILGVGPKMIIWSKNFIAGSTQFVEINGHRSEEYSSSVGVRQGRRISPDYYNIGSITAAFWTALAESLLYADDGINIIYANTIEECNAKLKSVALELASWYDLVGLSLNVKKSEVMGFGFTPDIISINNESIIPSKSIKFLGLTIQSDLKWNTHVDLICNKLRASAGRIRFEGRHFTTNDRKTLYFAWTQGCLLSNGLAFLPRLNSSEVLKLQVACNAAVRAVLRLPRFGYLPITSLRQQLRIPSVEQLTKKLILEAAWKKNHLSVVNRCLPGVTTRGRSNLEMVHPNQNGYRAHMISTKCDIAWNELPLEIKKEPAKSKAFNRIKKFALNF